MIYEKRLSKRLRELKSAEIYWGNPNNTTIDRYVIGIDPYDIDKPGICYIFKNKAS